MMQEFDKIKVPYKVKALEAGDYTNDEGNFLIERKDRYDLVNSLKNGRLYDEIDKMKSISSGNIILLVEGSLYAAANRNPHLKEYIFSVVGECIKRGIMILNTLSKYETAKEIYWIDRKLNSESIPSVIRAIRRATNYGKLDRKMVSITAIPGLGVERAINLANKFKTLKSLANAEVVDIIKVNKIGKKLAERVYNHFNEEINCEQ